MGFSCVWKEGCSGGLLQGGVAQGVTVTAPNSPWGSGCRASGRDGDEEGVRHSRGEEDAQGMGTRRKDDAAVGEHLLHTPAHTTGRCFADQLSLRNPGMSQLWDVFSPLRWTSASGEQGSQLQPGLAHPPGTPSTPRPRRQGDTSPSRQ